MLFHLWVFIVSVAIAVLFWEIIIKPNKTEKRKTEKRMLQAPTTFFVHDTVKSVFQQPTPPITTNEIILPNVQESLSLEEEGIRAMQVSHNGLLAFDRFTQAIEDDHSPTSVLFLGSLYANGIHGSVNPDKVSAARIYQMIEDHASKFPQHVVQTARQHRENIMSQLVEGLRDTDVVYGIPFLPSQYVFGLLGILATFRDIHDGVGERDRRELQTTVVPQPYRRRPAVTTTTEADYDDEAYMRDVTRMLQNDDPLAEIARVQVVVNNDSQNVHSSTVMNCAEKVLSTIATEQLISFDDASRLVLDASQKSEINVKKVNDVLRTFNDQTHAKFNQSDKTVFQRMMTTIQSETDETKKANLMEILGKQLESGVERGQVVCNTGRIVRILSVYDGVDDSKQTIVPEWALDQELANLAVRVRADMIQKASTDEKATYESPQGSEVLTERMKKEFEYQARALYQNIAPKRLDEKILIYNEGF